MVNLGCYKPLALAMWWLTYFEKDAYFNLTLIYPEIINKELTASFV
jgi:hypothetical protein